jgi:hypothetical protein
MAFLPSRRLKYAKTLTHQRQSSSSSPIFA